MAGTGPGARAPRVLVAGYNALDVVVPVAGLPAPDTKTAIGTIRLGGGGPVSSMRSSHGAMPIRFAPASRHMSMPVRLMSAYSH